MQTVWALKPSAIGLLKRAPSKGTKGQWALSWPANVSEWASATPAAPPFAGPVYLPGSNNDNMSELHQPFGPWGYNIEALAELVEHLSKLSFRLVTPSTGNQSLGKTSLRLQYQGLEDLLEAPHVTSLCYYFAKKSIMKLSSSYLTSLKEGRA